MMSNCARNSAACTAITDNSDETVRESDLMDKHNLTIDTVARMFKTSKLTLRLYEYRGLIARERSGQKWVYSWFECERIALLVKVRKAGLGIRGVGKVIKAMDEQAPALVADAGRQQCLGLIHSLEERQRVIGNVLGELYRIDWELSQRLGVKSTSAGSRLSGRH
jgi:DNA-binding transcriptional MerR regulator